MCDLEVAAVRTVRAREGTFLLPEQLALEHRFIERSAVERDEGMTGSRTLVVQRAREQTLAGARFAEQ